MILILSHFILSYQEYSSASVAGVEISLIDCDRPMSARWDVRNAEHTKHHYCPSSWKAVAGGIKISGEIKETELSLCLLPLPK